MAEINKLSVEKALEKLVEPTRASKNTSVQ